MSQFTVPLQLPVVATVPASPATGFVKVYVRAGLIRALSAQGVEQVLGGSGVSDHAALSNLQKVGTGVGLFHLSEALGQYLVALQAQDQIPLLAQVAQMLEAGPGIRIEVTPYQTIRITATGTTTPLTTPVAPAVSFNALTRVLTAAHPLGAGTLEFCFQNGPYTAYAPLQVDGAGYPAGSWSFRVQASAGNLVGALCPSPVIDAVAVPVYSGSYTTTAADYLAKCGSSAGSYTLTRTATSTLSVAAANLAARTLALMDLTCVLPGQLSYQATLQAYTTTPADYVNKCGSGATGPLITRSSNAGVSAVSQAAADALALAAATLAARTAIVCPTPPASFTNALQTYTTTTQDYLDRCGAGTSGPAVTRNSAAGTFSSAVSVADANTQALAAATVAAKAAIVCPVPVPSFNTTLNPTEFASTVTYDGAPGTQFKFNTPLSANTDPSPATMLLFFPAGTPVGQVNYSVFDTGTACGVIVNGTLYLTTFTNGDVTLS